MNKGSWQEHIDHVAAKGLLAKRLYVILTTPTGGLDALKEQLGAHLVYQKDLEARGITFAAGPFADDTEQEWSGEGMIIVRAASAAEAKGDRRCRPHASQRCAQLPRPAMAPE